MLANILGIGVQNRLNNIAQELGDLLGTAAGEGLGTELSLNFLAAQAEGGISLDTGNHVVGLARTDRDTASGRIGRKSIKKAPPAFNRKQTVLFYF